MWYAIVYTASAETLEDTLLFFDNDAQEFFLDDVEKFFKSQGHRGVEVGFGKSSSVEYTVYELREVATGVLQSNSIEVEIAEQADDSGH